MNITFDLLSIWFVIHLSESEGVRSERGILSSWVCLYSADCSVCSLLSAQSQPEPEGDTNSCPVSAQTESWPELDYTLLIRHRAPHNPVIALSSEYRESADTRIKCPDLSPEHSGVVTADDGSVQSPGEPRHWGDGGAHPVPDLWGAQWRGQDRELRHPGPQLPGEVHQLLEGPEWAGEAHDGHCGPPHHPLGLLPHRTADFQTYPLHTRLLMVREWLTGFGVWLPKFLFLNLFL